ncbi:uncharacterized protein LOC129761757 [Toxorhynchites rutilus septentrionalis]|uniref:uncharacterized protein LOC129761757 n=1 Tax=Toxorhynchites rutilus septentrionalis TaxID=329112 RepID=UPI00247B02D1|nr:uncharacterized protein LOC129761757 [Toxorhynchites rutilus septentrionalis]
MFFVVCLLLLLQCLAQDIKEERLTYKHCTCPCSDLAPVEVDPFFDGNANCVVIQNFWSNGHLFTSDKAFEGRHYVYHDVSHFRTKKWRYVHTNPWKIFYPWKNVSAKAEVPLVIQNILSMEYIVVTDDIVKQSFRQVVTIFDLTTFALWHFAAAPDGQFKIKNHVTREFLYADEVATDDWDQGKIFTNIVKLNRSDTHPGQYVFLIPPCYR